MIFTAITFIAAFLIEAIGTVVSVIGLSSLFGTNPIIIALAVALDIGKLVVVALLYKYWGTLNRLMKIYGVIAAVVTMTITSAGAAGYLSGQFQQAMVGTQEVALKVDLLKQEQTRLQQRKDQIDQQIAGLPERFSAAQRVRMINQFRTEQTTITNRLAEIDKELPTLKVTQINSEAKAGPILYIAKAFNISIEEAVKWVILLIVFVFDPLAVFLIVAGNFLLEQHRKNRTFLAETPQVNEPEVERPAATNTLPPIVEALVSPVPTYPNRSMSPGGVEPAQMDTFMSKIHGNPRYEVEAVAASMSEALETARPTPPEPNTTEPEEEPVARTYQEEPEPEVRPPVEPEPEPEEGPVARTYQEEPEPEVRPPVEPEPVEPPTEPSEPSEITRSTLGAVRPDQSVKMIDTGEIGYKTGAYKTGFYHPGS